jgi:hypothetical protein
MAYDHTEFIGRKNSQTRYDPASKFDRRLKSLNRPTKVQEAALPSDTPTAQFISKPRTSPG